METLILLRIRRGGEVVEEDFRVVDINGSIKVRGELFNTGLALKYVPQRYFEIKPLTSSGYKIVFHNIHKEYLSTKVLVDNRYVDVDEPGQYLFKATTRVKAFVKREDIVVEIDIVPEQVDPGVKNAIHYYWLLRERNYRHLVLREPEEVFEELKDVEVERRDLEILFKAGRKTPRLLMNTLLLLCINKALDGETWRYFIRVNGVSKTYALIDQLYALLNALCVNACREFNYSVLEAVVNAYNVLGKARSETISLINDSFKKFDFLFSLTIPVFSILVYLFSGVFFSTVYIPVVSLLVLSLMILSSITSVHGNIVESSPNKLSLLVEYIRRRGDLLLAMLLIIAAGLPVVVDLLFIKPSRLASLQNIGLNPLTTVLTIFTIILSLTMISLMSRVEEHDPFFEKAFYRLIYRRILLVITVFLATTLYYSRSVDIDLYIVSGAALSILLLILLYRLNKSLLVHGKYTGKTGFEKIAYYCLLKKMRRTILNYRGFKMVYEELLSELEKDLNYLDKLDDLSSTYIKQYVEELRIASTGRARSRVVKQLIRYIDSELNRLKKHVEVGGLCGI